MLKWFGKRFAKGALQQAEDRALAISGKVLDILKAPPQAALDAWNGLSPEDKQLFKDAAVSAARITARLIIAADKGGKVQF